LTVDAAAPLGLARHRQVGSNGGIAYWLVADDGMMDRGGGVAETRAAAMSRVVCLAADGACRIEVAVPERLAHGDRQARVAPPQCGTDVSESGRSKRC
jgi:hypothetical protein